jgi:predicted glycoside hydrolase/deacetylase ChbG (UPF0249 family)
MADIQLVVQADDLGMCHAVNEGIQHAFEGGIVTQTVAMAPCAWIDEAARIAKSSGIHAGMHSTLTSEWEYLRWRPFTNGASLTGADGTFHRTLDGAIATVEVDDAVAELEAQYDHLQGLGLQPAYFDVHMGPVSPGAFARMVAAHARPFLYPLASPHYQFDSLQMLSHRGADEKLDWTLAYLDALTPGNHYLCTHPAAAAEELSALTPRDADNAPWTDTYRISDLDVLTDPRLRERIEARGIALVTVESIPTD